MAGLLLDAGALIAAERGRREVERALGRALRLGHDLVTAAPVLAQVWREGAKQVRLTRALRAIDVVALDHRQARACGELLGASGTSDVPNASLAVLAAPGDVLLTTDPRDLERLIAARGLPGIRVAAL